MKLQKMGMRTIKTGISVTLCMILGDYLVENMFYSLVACIISVQDTVKGSLKTGINRVEGTILGGIIGFIFAIIKAGDPFLCGLGVMCSIYLCNLFKIKSVVVACVTFLAIHLGVGNSDPVYYSLHRVLDTSVGVLFGVLVNYYVARPNYLNSVIDEFKKIEELSMLLIEDKILRKENLNVKKFEEEVEKLEEIYSKLIDELDYSLSETNIEKIENALRICREIHFHMQSIELLENKLYLKEHTYKYLKKTYNVDKLDWNIDEEKSPVFNYHLMKIMIEIELLRKLNKSY
ncbi:TPA: FUSC family protein [Clostridioides difficile]|nr:FUSC family protein [Clostridioides difficile]MDN9832761.1 FUSC family protein [Clostridioides difficile]HBG1230976.1 FUSC family protein [Clostridioides difficile]HBG1233904.1 FUSC family protein [Clostridioides difficile]